MLTFIMYLQSDYYVRYGTNFNLIKFIKAYMLDINYRVVVRYRIQYFLMKSNNKVKRLIALCIRNGNIKKYGIEIGLSTNIGKGFHVHHVNGIVIGEGVVIGENFNVFQQVTLGQKHNKYPIIGDDVWVYSGARIIGDIKIGDNSIIGMSSVVIKNVEPNRTVAGIPATVLNTYEKEE